MTAVAWAIVFAVVTWQYHKEGVGIAWVAISLTIIILYTIWDILQFIEHGLL